MRSTARTMAYATGVAGILLAAVLGFWARNAVLEQYHLWNLRTGNATSKKIALAKLASVGTERAVVPLWAAVTEAAIDPATPEESAALSHAAVTAIERIASRAGRRRGTTLYELCQTANEPIERRLAGASFLLASVPESAAEVIAEMLRTVHDNDRLQISNDPTADSTTTYRKRLNSLTHAEAFAYTLETLLRPESDVAVVAAALKDLASLAKHVEVPDNSGCEVIIACKRYHGASCPFASTL